MRKPLSDPIVLTIASIIILEGASWLSFAYPETALPLFFIVSLAVVSASVSGLEWGVSLALIELMIGSLGTMLVLPIAGFDLTLRMVLWIAVLASWSMRFVFSRSREMLRPLFQKQFILLGAVILWGVVWGAARGNGAHQLIADVNNYFYYALLLPAYAAAQNTRFIKQIPYVFLAAGAWVAGKTLMLYYVFSHELFGAQDVLYTWSRQARLAEITNVDPQLVLSRVFMQSQIWLVFGICVLLGCVYVMTLRKKGDASEKAASAMPLLLVVFVSAIIASFSRSFWLAIGVSYVLMLAVLLVFMRERIRGAASFGAVSVGIVALAIALTVGIAQFPIPRGTSSAELIKGRAMKFSGESAISSRYAQIRPLLSAIKNHPILGSGFGTSVTYASRDPRVQKDHPDGRYTTTAFELGWLEMWLKIGLLGVFMYAYLLYAIIQKGWKKILPLPHESQERYLVLGSLIGLIAVAITHGISPYLNHPLGIGIVIVVSIVVDRKA